MDLVFWPAPVKVHPFDAHVRAAVAGRFTHLAIQPLTIRQTVTGGSSLREMRQTVVDAGLALSHLDIFTDWLPARFPSDASEARKERLDFSSAACFEYCESLGISRILAWAGCDIGSVSKNAIIDGFGGLCERAARSGIDVDLEFAPVSAVPDLGFARDVVDAVSAPNGRIMFDTWHFVRTGADFDLLENTPDGQISSCQVADAMFALNDKTLYESTIQDRLFPGEGEFPLVRILRALLQKGILNIGPEIYSLATDAMSASNAGAKSGNTLREVIRQAEASLI